MELKLCPSCRGDVDDYLWNMNQGHVYNYDNWECPFCHEPFDVYWVLEAEICWFPTQQDVFYDFPHLGEIQSTMLHNDIVTRVTCICCDKLYEKCKERPPSLIITSSVKRFLHDKSIFFTDVYSGSNGSACQTCYHYAEDGCIPLRNILRQFQITKTLPAYSLSECAYYEPDDSAVNQTSNDNVLPLSQRNQYDDYTDV